MENAIKLASKNGRRISQSRKIKAGFPEALQPKSSRDALRSMPNSATCTVTIRLNAAKAVIFTLLEFLDTADTPTPMNLSN